MNWVGKGSRTLRDLAATYDRTSEPPFLSLGDGSFFLAI